jgi:hypothetical protein
MLMMAIVDEIKRTRLGGQLVDGEGALTTTL